MQKYYGDIMENRFTTQNELYRKVLPALKTKKNEMYREGIRCVKEIDLWEYHKEFTWRKAKGLTLASIVNDILNTDSKLYEDYIVKRYRESDEYESTN